MSILREIKSNFSKWIKNASLTINCNALHKEVSADFPVDRSQIDTWYKRYKQENNFLSHPYVEIAHIYMNACMHDRASDFYLRFLEKKDDKIIHSLYLQNLLLSASATNESLLKAHQNWANIHIAQLPKQMKHSKLKKSASEKIKIGYVCHFFTNSISQNALLPLLKMHDRNKFDVFCYNDGEMPQDSEQYSQHWRDIRGFSDEAVAQLIKEDGIDILQELNGFCIINRFGALAYRPAPIQINWYNHTSTTGLPFIDYVMSDVVSIPDSDLSFFVEKAYRHKKFIAAVNFEENKFGEIIKEVPFKKNGYITFCYFGGSHKITMQSIELWSRILQRVPHSRMILKCGSFSHDRYQNIFINHFSRYGIGKKRIFFEGWSDQFSTLRKYNEIDIMLDNVPVNGGSTMTEALLQGVPVVTLMGNRWAARSGPSVLTTLGHPELIAKSQDDYVNLAVNLANDIATLNNYRAKLRSDMLDSSLTNIQHYYRNFEEAYLYMWDCWCNEENEKL